MGEGAERAREFGDVVVERHTDVSSDGTAGAFALLEHRIAIRAEREQDVWRGGVSFDCVAEKAEYVVDRIAAAASLERRHVEVHQQRVCDVSSKDDVDDLARDLAAVLLQGGDWRVDRIGNAGARQQVQGLQLRSQLWGERRYVEPARRQKSAPSTLVPPPFPNMTTRRVGLSGLSSSSCKASSVSRNSSSVSVSTMMTCRDSASQARESPANAPVCEAAAMRPCRDRPPRRTTIGFLCAVVRKRSKNAWPCLMSST